MNKLKCVQAILSAITTVEVPMKKESKMKIMPFEYRTPHKENVMKLKYMSLILVIATAYDLPNTTAYTPWSAGPAAGSFDRVCRNDGTCVQLAADWLRLAKKAALRKPIPAPASKADKKAKEEKKAAKAKEVKAAQAAEHRALNSRKQAIASWLEKRKVCTAPAASRQVRKARSIRAKARAIANRAVLVSEWVNPNEGNIPSWIKAPIGMILPMPAHSKGKAQVRRMARYQASPWGRAKAEEQAKREEARNQRHAIRIARLAEDRNIRMSRDEARAAKSAQKAAAKVAPKKGNLKKAYMAAIPAPTAIPTTRTIRCIAKINGRVVATDTLCASEAVAYLERQGYKAVAAPVPTAAAPAPVAPVAPRVAAEATPAHAIKVASAAKADGVIAEFFSGKVKLFTIAALQVMVTDGVYDLAGNLNPDQKAALWAERQARQNRVKVEKVDKSKAAEAMFLKANPVYAEFKAKQNPKHTKPLMGQKVATVTQEGTK